jgi:hypothetical protein
VSFSDTAHWGSAVVECIDPASGKRGGIEDTAKHPEKYCWFDLAEGRWRFTGTLQQPSPVIKADERHLRAPVAFVTLEVQQ